MPWKTSEEVQARRQFIKDRLTRRATESMVAACRRHQISRECGHKWWRRFCAEGWKGLQPQSRLTATVQRLRQRWRPRLLQVQHQHRDFGPKKLHWQLQVDYPRQRLPTVRTLARWLERAGRTRRRPRRPRPGPTVRLPGRLTGRCVNDVWTIDFKGSFRTRDGQRIYPLTVRDLASRYILCVQHLRQPNDRLIGRVMRRLFRRYGLPRALRLDNGQPFGAIGPRGWSRLNIAWLKLGIRPEHGRPGCPQDNPAHEQMHGVLKAQTCRPASANPRAQQQRFERWRWRYNHGRPHESLGMRVPAACYRPGARPWPKHIPAWRYPKCWLRLRPDAKGRWVWRGRARYIGRALAGERLGAKSLDAVTLALHLGPHLLGHLHAADLTGLRAIRRQSSPRSGRG